MHRILCLGNEFVEEDSLAKEIGNLLGKKGYDVVNIKDSFELMSLLNSENDFIILDVVQGLKKVKEISVEDLRQDNILSAHDFDAGYVLKLINKEVRIIGIPQSGDVEEIMEEVLRLV